MRQWEKALIGPEATFRDALISIDSTERASPWSSTVSDGFWVPCPTATCAVP